MERVTVGTIDESCGQSPKPFGLDIRRATIGAWEAGLWFSNFKRTSPIRRMTELGVIIRLYWNPPWRWSTKPRTRMDVNKLADAWIEAVVGMSLAHDKDDYDANDAKSDELMTPILAAPIRQVREFYHVLLAKMKADKRVPMLVWMGFEGWGDIVVKDAPDEGIKRLKNKLAGEIADLVELQVQDQIPEAIKRALRWRDEETLTEVRDTLKAGAKPKLVGRQSCLFLRVGRGKKCREVML